jgi:hypothetical protein
MFSFSSNVIVIEDEMYKSPDTATHCWRKRKDMIRTVVFQYSSFWEVLRHYIFCNERLMCVGAHYHTILGMNRNMRGCFDPH